MALTIILVLIFGAIVWGVFMTHTKSGARRSQQFQKPNYLGTVRRHSQLGRPVIQTDEQRSEVLRMNRDRYDPSIDLLDPRNEKYRGGDQPGASSSETN